MYFMSSIYGMFLGATFIIAWFGRIHISIYLLFPTSPFHFGRAEALALKPFLQVVTFPGTSIAFQITLVTSTLI